LEELVESGDRWHTAVWWWYAAPAVQDAQVKAQETVKMPCTRYPAQVKAPAARHLVRDARRSDTLEVVKQ